MPNLNDVDSADLVKLVLDSSMPHHQLFEEACSELIRRIKANKPANETDSFQRGKYHGMPEVMKEDAVYSAAFQGVNLSAKTWTNADMIFFASWCYGVPEYKDFKNMNDWASVLENYIKQHS